MDTVEESDAAGCFSSKSASDVCEYLMVNGIEGSICDTFEENEIDGEAFMELTVEDVKSLVPNKLGVVKKIMRLIKKELVNVTDPKPLSLSPGPAVTPTRTNSLSSRMSPFSPPLRTQFSPESSDGASIASSSVSNVGKQKFEIPDNWRPSIMSCFLAEGDVEKRKRLTPQVRNEIVRDIVTTMFAHMPQPDKVFCKSVAKMLTEKYKFLKDVSSTTGSGYGSWEKKIHECVNNKKKGATKRQRVEDGTSSPAKRGRPRSNPTLARYPPLQQGGDDAEAEEALKLELANTPPRKEYVIPLLKKTFPARRQFILACAESVGEILEEHPVLKFPFAVEQEIDYILEKKDVVSIAGMDWKRKWVPAIQAYAQNISGKMLRLSVKTINDMYQNDAERDEKIGLALLTKFLRKDDSVYQEYSMADDPDDISKKATTLKIAGFKDPATTGSYYVLVEHMVLCNVSSFTTALMLWFIAHYVFHLRYAKETSELALFFQEFILGLPNPSQKKTSTYLTVTSDIQMYSSH